MPPPHSLLVYWGLPGTDGNTASWGPVTSSCYQGAVLGPALPGDEPDPLSINVSFRRDYGDGHGFGAVEPAIVSGAFVPGLWNHPANAIIPDANVPPRMYTLVVYPLPGINRECIIESTLSATCLGHGTTETVVQQNTLFCMNFMNKLIKKTQVYATGDEFSFTVHDAQGLDPSTFSVQIEFPGFAIPPFTPPAAPFAVHNGVIQPGWDGTFLEISPYVWQVRLFIPGATLPHLPVPWQAEMRVEYFHLSYDPFWYTFQPVLPPWPLTWLVTVQPGSAPAPAIRGYLMETLVDDSLVLPAVAVVGGAAIDGVLINNQAFNIAMDFANAPVPPVPPVVPVYSAHPSWDTTRGGRKFFVMANSGGLLDTSYDRTMRDTSMPAGWATALIGDGHATPAKAGLVLDSGAGGSAEVSSPTLDNFDVEVTVELLAPIGYTAELPVALLKYTPNTGDVATMTTHPNSVSGSAGTAAGEVAVSHAGPIRLRMVRCDERLWGFVGQVTPDASGLVPTPSALVFQSTGYATGSGQLSLRVAGINPKVAARFTDFTVRANATIDGKLLEARGCGANTWMSGLVPATDFARQGARDVVVFGPFGSSTLTNGFTYVLPRSKTLGSGSTWRAASVQDPAVEDGD